MIHNNRLIKEISGTKRYIFMNVLLKWISLISNIFMIYYLAEFIEKIYYKNELEFAGVFISASVNLIVKVLSSKANSRIIHKISADIKGRLRRLLYNKIYNIGSSYESEVGTTEIIQLETEGIEQLDMYYCNYIPQLIYSIAAPLTLFAFISAIDFKTALVLLICVPMIPIIIFVIQGVARKLFGKYWGDYTDLSKIFLENIQGLTILKSYKADEMKNIQMNEKAEKFRKSTMKVLYMQLNSIVAMDVVAYGGAALGIGVALSQFLSGNIGLASAITIILISSEFFIPMRLLGSFFHVAMNGIAASKRMFEILDIENGTERTEKIEEYRGIEIKNLRFSYDDEEIIKGIDMSIPEEGLISIVGESGSGKSTIAGIIMGINRGYSGSIKIDGKELSKIAEESIMKNITMVRHDSHIYKGTVRENLKIAKNDASDEEMENALKKVNLYEFFKSIDGLDTEIEFQGSNLSGGQKQRLAIARAILHDTPAYVMDEVTSNIDSESEGEIMEVIKEISKEKTVVMISHRLANTVNSRKIYVLKDGTIESEGNYEQLMNRECEYRKIFSTQKELEEYSAVKDGIKNEK